ncbi:MAG: zinc-binding dehydrogenase [Candidatus Lokiarchaeota archaeon]|nr:zinc-binding dehydrogenase [Candidatus Lokiarchaeota archaeon]
MKAIIWMDYGPPDVLKLEEREKPRPKDNEVLIKIYATTVAMGDCEFRSLKLSFGLRILMRLVNGLTHPKRLTILGQEFAGEIESIGDKVTKFNKGDQIFGATDFGMGAYAEYKCLPEDGALALKPLNISFKQAAAIPVGGLNALYFLKKTDIQKTQKILINGAGGSIGTIAVQLAKYYGAEVTAIDSTKKLDMLRSIGADYVIDYTQEDFTERGETYDVIFDIVGKAPYSGCLKSLKKDGFLLLGNPKLSRVIRGKFSTQKVIGGSAEYSTENLNSLKKLIDKKILKPVIDKVYSLDQIVDAHEYVESGQKQGNVVIQVRNHPPDT